MEQRESSELINLKGSVCSKKAFEVEVVPNYADHELGMKYFLAIIKDLVEFQLIS